MLTLLHEKTVGYTGYGFCFKAISSGPQKKIDFPSFCFPKCFSYNSVNLMLFTQGQEIPRSLLVSHSGSKCNYTLHIVVYCHFESLVVC